MTGPWVYLSQSRRYIGKEVDDPVDTPTFFVSDIRLMGTLVIQTPDPGPH